MNTVKQWIAAAAEQLAEDDDPQTGKLEAELLLSHVTGYSRVSFFAHPERALTSAQETSLSELLAKRIDGVPIAYLTGEKEFWSLTLTIGPGVLVPRPDTETLVETALNLHSELPDGYLIELGTGSGAIALALAQEIANRPIVAIERNDLALHVAAKNIQQFGFERVHLIQASWLDALQTHSAAMIVSNPPYLAAEDEHLSSLKHEPHNALVSGQTGLEDLEAIIKDSCRVCIPGGALLLEHGYQQGQDVRSLLTHYNYQQVQTNRDLAGHERVSYGYTMMSTQR